MPYVIKFVTSNVKKKTRNFVGLYDINMFLHLRYDCINGNFILLPTGCSENTLVENVLSSGLIRNISLLTH
jgi:hypothetical protein